MTEEPRSTEGLKPCPEIMYVCEICAAPDNNPEGCGHYDRDMVRKAPDGQWVCESCYDDINPNKDYIVRLWPNWRELPQSPEVSVALPRPTADTVERAAVERLASLALEVTTMFAMGGGNFVLMAELEKAALAIRALPASGGGGEEKLRAALRKIANNEVEYVGSLAKQYADIAKAALQQEQDK